MHERRIYMYKYEVQYACREEGKERTYDRINDSAREKYDQRECKYSKCQQLSAEQ